jgi:predicted DNA-binding protein YlxM (UPF0122 family)
MRLAGSLFLSCSLLLLGAPGAVKADEPPRTAAARGDGSSGSSVSENIRRGQRAREAGRWAEAEAAYRAALSAPDAAKMTEVKRSEIIGEIGLCELALQKYRDAAEHLAESLQQRAALSLKLQQRFEDGQRSAEAHVVRFYLGVNPADAEVLLDPVTAASRSCHA